MDARVDSRIPMEIKKKASKELANHGLSISAYIRLVLTSVANDGLPKYWGLPNSTTLTSLDEAVDDLVDPHLPSAHSTQELEKLLNEWDKIH